MPLILFTGFPSSGKSTFAKQLSTFLQGEIEKRNANEPGHGMKVIVHSDESLGIPHADYAESRTEKSVRGAQMSAVKRDLSKKNIVILDSPAYIKGFRYQLHCEAKGYSTSYCVIHVVAPSEVCFELNEKRPTDEQWDPEILKQMILRYEEPDGNNRWDSPLFNVAYDDEKLPLEELWRVLILSAPPKPNSATVLKPSSGTNFLQQLDRLTGSVINSVLQFQQLQSVGGSVMVRNTEGSSQEELYVHLPAESISIAQLQRIRRSYVALNRMRSVDDDRIIPLFVEYLNNALASD